MKRRLIIVFALLLSTDLLTGCGGGGGQSGSAASSGATGQAQFTVVWPAQAASHAVGPKLIPSAANSIVLTLQLGQAGSSAPLSQILTRPTIGNTSTATFTNLPPGGLHRFYRRAPQRRRNRHRAGAGHSAADNNNRADNHGEPDTCQHYCQRHCDAQSGLRDRRSNGPSHGDRV